MSDPIRFALNHMLAPRLRFAAFAALARGLGVTDVEIRNDLAGVEIADQTPAARVRAEAAAAGVRLLTINALQKFEWWDDTRAAEAESLAAYAAEAGAAALVLCPLNSHDDRRDGAARAADLRRALAGLAPILARHGLRGFVEPLGFTECALRSKAAAVAAIRELGLGERFALVHDTFHHHLAGEPALFPAETGLVHISGVEDAAVAVGDMRDAHRVLVGPRDRLGNLAQITALRAAGYTGPFSFEPFAESVHRSADIAADLAASIAFLRDPAAG
ncbi:MAG: TIM barrel protein [Acetobacteraceae bacterium]